MEVNKVEKEVYLEIPKANYRAVQKSFYHLRDITLSDTDNKKELLVHIIIGAGDYTKNKTQERARIGLPGQPIEELTKLGLVVISLSQEKVVTNMLYSKTTVHHYENLCSLNVLRIEENHKKGISVVYEQFQK